MFVLSIIMIILSIIIIQIACYIMKQSHNSKEWQSPLSKTTLDQIFSQQVISISLHPNLHQPSSIYRQDYQSLLPNRWLRTEAINIIITLLLEQHRQSMNKVYGLLGQFQQQKHREYVKLVDAFVVTLIMTSHQEYILKSLEGLKLFEENTKYLLFPVNTQNGHGSHWLLGLLVNGLFGGKKQEWELYMFDSGSSGTQTGMTLKLNLQNMYEILHGSRIQIILKRAQNIPFQNNGHDCGIYTIAFSEYVLNEMVTELQEGSKLELNRLNTVYKYLIGNSSHTRERYRRMLQSKLIGRVVGQ